MLVLSIARVDPTSAQATAIPGRDLLGFPVGLIAEPAALPGLMGVGLFNPAAALLPAGAKWRIAAGAMSTPADVGASAQAFGASTAWRGATVTTSVVRAGVGGLVRTDSDPLTVQNDVVYSTLVASLGVAMRPREHVTVGFALRARSGQMDFDSRSGVALDAGVVAEHLTSLDARIGASSYLLNPWAGPDDAATWILGADARVAGTDSTRTLRAGVSANSTHRRPSEQFAFASVRYGAWEIRGGPVRTVAYGATNIRSRLAVAVRYAGYMVGVSREESPSGLTPSYQVALSSVVP